MEVDCEVSLAEEMAEQQHVCGWGSYVEETSVSKAIGQQQAPGGAVDL